VDACAWAQEQGLLKQWPVRTSVAAVSVGVVEGELRLDLHYDDDVTADTDMNVVMTGDGRFVEVQGTAEGEPFERDTLDALLAMAQSGCAELTELQNAALAHEGPRPGRMVDGTPATVAQGAAPGGGA
jgi:ribonuclease PH